MKETLEIICQNSIDKNPDKANNYKLGKTALIGFFVADVIKTTNKYSPEAIINCLKRLLK